MPVRRYPIRHTACSFLEYFLSSSESALMSFRSFVSDPFAFRTRLLIAESAFDWRGEERLHAACPNDGAASIAAIENAQRSSPVVTFRAMGSGLRVNPASIARIFTNASPFETFGLTSSIASAPLAFRAMRIILWAMKTVIVDIAPQGTPKEDLDARMAELENLVSTYGGITVVKRVQKRDNPDYSTYVGTGKLEELVAA